MGTVYLVAFTSLSRQVLGLYGKRGILPAAEFLERVRVVVGRERYGQFPTLLWLDSSDRALSLHYAPFFVLGSRGAHRVAYWALSGLQGAFALTGNYGFINLLSFVLGVWLLDDGALAPLVGRARPRRSSRASRSARNTVDLLAGAPLFVLSVAKLARGSRGTRASGAPFAPSRGPWAG